jgi:Uma2 family endonuclease
MRKKREFYDRYGVEEYYEYDPDRGTLAGGPRRAGRLEPMASMEGWVSPLLGIRFGLEGTDLALHHPDGQRFETFVEQARRAKAEQQRAEIAQQRAEAERQRAEAARQHAEAAQQRAERLAERLRQLGVDPDALEQ